MEQVGNTNRVREKSGLVLKDNKLRGKETNANFLFVKIQKFWLITCKSKHFFQMVILPLFTLTMEQSNGVMNNTLLASATHCAFRLLLRCFLKKENHGERS